MAGGISLTGDRELQAALHRLGRQSAGHIARVMVGAGAAVLADAIRQEAPGRVADEIGSRVESSPQAMVARAKAGVGVGRKQRNGIGHFFAAGTQQRFRKRIGGRYRFIRNPTPTQLSTGIMPANPLVSRASSRVRNAVLQVMKRRAVLAIQRAALQGRG